jgi:hypothetical protein
MKHVTTISRIPAIASTTIDTISETKLESKESFLGGKVSGL